MLRACKVGNIFKTRVYVRGGDSIPGPKIGPDRIPYDTGITIIIIAQTKIWDSGEDAYDRWYVTLFVLTECAY